MRVREESGVRDSILGGGELWRCVGCGCDDVLEGNHQVEGVDVENRTCKVEGWGCGSEQAEENRKG